MTTPASPSEVLDHLRQQLLPQLLSSSLSVSSFHSRWRLLHSSLSRLLSLLSHPSLLSSSNPSININSHPLLLHLLPNLSSTLSSLASLASRCSSPSPLSGGKLHLQSDLDISSSLLSLHLHDLHVLLRSGLLLLHQPSNDAAAIVLPLPGPASTKSDILMFVRDAFARLQIGGVDLKQKAVESLKDLIDSDPAKISLLIAQEGDVSALIRLLDPMNHSLIRDQAAAVVSSLCTGSEASRKALFEEGAMGPLLRLLETGSAILKENAAMAIEAITSDRSNAWAISAYGGVEVLIAACRSGGGSPAVHALAAGSLKNIAAVDDMRTAMIEEGAVPVLIDLLGSGTNLAKKNAAICLWSLASEGDEETRAKMFEQGSLQSLMQLVRESTDHPEILEHGLRAIQALSSCVLAAKALSSSHLFFSQLTELIRFGNISIQQLSVSLISSLSLNEDIKRSMSVCIPLMIKMLELPKPTSAQEVAAEALVCLLSIRSNRIELGRDGKSMTKLVQMLDPKREEICKKFPVAVVVALAASGGCRKRLNELGACQQLQKLVDAEVNGSKKALKMMAGSKLKNLFSLSWRELSFGN